MKKVITIYEADPMPVCERPDDCKELLPPGLPLVDGAEYVHVGNQYYAIRSESVIKGKPGRFFDTEAEWREKTSHQNT